MRNFWLLLFLVLFAACNDNQTLFEENIPLDTTGWDYTNILEFEVPVKNVSDTFNLFVNVRYNKQFQWRNLWVVVHTDFPDGHRENARVNLKLESSKGERYGKCTGDICFVQVPIQYNAIFPDTGLYKFSIEQSMRMNPLKDIEHIGLRIEKSEVLKKPTG